MGIPGRSKAWSKVIVATESGAAEIDAPERTGATAAERALVIRIQVRQNIVLF